jgi:hypothetical protein
MSSPPAAFRCPSHHGRHRYFRAVERPVDHELIASTVTPKIPTRYKGLLLDEVGAGGDVRPVAMR